MRIYSKFHDYYDTALGHGFDPNVRYVRTQYELTAEEYDKSPVVEEVIEKVIGRLDLGYGGMRQGLWFDSLQVFKQERVSVSNGAIGFCGRVIPFIRLHREASSLNGLFTAEVTYHYNEADMVLRLNSLGWDSAKYFSGISDDHRWSLKKFNHDSVVAFLARYYADDKPFFELGEPCFLLTHREFTINPCLKDVQFGKAFDAYTAFQELSMYLGGVMGGAHPPMVSISDKDMAAKKGFDKWSFRRMPWKNV